MKMQIGRTLSLTTATLALALAAGCDGTGTDTEPGVVAPQAGAVSPETEIPVSRWTRASKRHVPSFALTSWERPW